MVSLSSELVPKKLIKQKAPTRSGPSKLAKRRGRPPGSRNSTAPHLSNSKVTKQQDRAGQSSVKRQRTAGAKGADREGAKKKRGRAARVSNAVAEEEVDELSFTQPKVVPKATGGPVEQAGSARTRRRPSGTRNEDKDANEEGESHSKARNYAQLAPRTRRIAREVMESWPVVSAQVMDQMIETLREAKKEVVNTQRDEQRAMAADETLGSMVRMLARQLSGSRIPPQAKDIHFNIDKLTERYGHLFRELSTERHSHQLLTEQVKVAQQLLKRDEARLEQVKKNAREWKVRWRQQERQGRVRSRWL